jgi:hypothetical protein
MRVIVTGSRQWTNEAAIRRELAKLPAGATLVHGDCAGADEIAGRLGRDEFRLMVVQMVKEPPDYAKYDRAAWKGLNERMLESGAELVLAFHEGLHDPEQARGTRHMVELARARGVEVRTFAS